MTGKRRDEAGSVTGSRQRRRSWQVVGQGHMMGRHGRGIMRCHGAMCGWGHGQLGCMIPKGADQGAKGLAKGARPGRHSTSLVCFTNFSKENVKLRKGLGKIIYCKKDGVIYLTQKMKDELIHHSNCNQIVLQGRNCITFLSFYQGF